MIVEELLVSISQMFSRQAGMHCFGLCMSLKVAEVAAQRRHYHQEFNMEIFEGELLPASRMLVEYITSGLFLMLVLYVQAHIFTDSLKHILS